MSLEIVDLDPFDAAAFEAWHRVYLRAQHAMGAAATPWMLEELRAVMQQTGASAWSGGWSAVAAGETVGAGFLRTPLLDNLELAELDVHVDPAHQRRGIGAALLAHVEGAALRELASELDPRHFWQVHRGTIVNIRAIASVASDDVSSAHACRRSSGTGPSHDCSSYVGCARAASSARAASTESCTGRASSRCTSESARS